MVEIRDEFEKLDDGIRRRKDSVRNQEKLPELEATKWDQKEDVEIRNEFEKIDDGGIRRRKDSIRNQEKLLELEAIKWDQKEDFTTYITRFCGLVNDAGLDDASEQRKVELFLKSLPPNLNDIMQKQIQKQFKVHKPLNPDFQPTLEHLITNATIYIDEIRNKTLTKSLCSLNEAVLNNKEIVFRYIVMSLVIFIVFFVPYIFFDKPDDDSIFRDFAKSTEDIVSKINEADLPGSNEIMKHTVECKRTANLIERDPAFKNTGAVIATKLRKFGESVMEAGNDLQIMYRKGSYVFETFKIEIKTMMDRFDIQEPNKGEFFKERINKMILVVQDFSNKVKKAKDSILDAENNRDGLEKELISGIREAEKFMETTGYWKPDSVDLRKAEDGLATVNNILLHLRGAAYRLDEIIKNLRRYENSLFDVNAELGSIFIITKHDFNYLLNSIDVLHRYHRQFMAKENN
ncbi:33035_t:CDS:2 [Racocetra persica]|uniref:33035_t:CDS:1 n=1 Tax=Racocetra persica TaxID=160502 RepID=A0ACA9Q193_9GLOM|nr:33035_t:CDS:2 [Racocetra persica]